MVSRPLNALLVSEDRSLLRRLWRFLNASGYAVQTVADPRQVAAWEAGPWDFWIVDAGCSLSDALEIVRLAADNGPGGPPCYTFLLSGPDRDADGALALEAGVDDFLAKPVVYGELLARLRAAARELEFRRRMEEQVGIEPVTQLPNAAAFEGRLKAALPRQGQAEGACVLLELDLYEAAVRVRGRSAGNSALAAVAGILRSLCDPPAIVASFGDGKFGVLLPGLSEAEAAAWADGLRDKVSETDFSFGEHRFHLTASAGVAKIRRDTDQTVEDARRQADEALVLAKTSGGNRVVTSAQVEEDAQTWAEFAAPGKLWERTVARDIMTSCPCTLRITDSAVHAADLLRRTRLEAVPVVDNRGRLAGIVSEQVLAKPAAESDAQRVGEVMLTDVPTREEDASFAALREFFQHDPDSCLVITRDRRPVGTIHLNNLAALGSKLAADTFLPPNPFSSGSDYLVVPDLCPAEEG